MAPSPPVNAPCKPYFTGLPPLHGLSMGTHFTAIIPTPGSAQLETRGIHPCLTDE